MAQCKLSWGSVEEVKQLFLRGEMTGFCTNAAIIVSKRMECGFAFTKLLSHYLLNY